MTENKYQSQLIERLRERFPGCEIVKNDPNLRQGIPDLTIFIEDFWAMLECKAYRTAPVQPNQRYYVQWADRQSFGRFIYPENEEVVLLALQKAFESRGRACFSESQFVSLD